MKTNNTYPLLHKFKHAPIHDADDEMLQMKCPTQRTAKPNGNLSFISRRSSGITFEGLFPKM